MMLGSLSIKREAGLWSRPDASGYLAVAAVGVLAGIAVAYARLPLHLPGHKALLWIPPVLAARILTGRRFGGSAGALATLVTTLALGGRLAGSAAGAPLVVIAGFILDLAVSFTSRFKPPRLRVLLLLAASGGVANLICFVKRLFELNDAFYSSNMEQLWRAAVSHFVFGFTAGALAALLTNTFKRIATEDAHGS